MASGRLRRLGESFVSGGDRDGVVLYSLHFEHGVHGGVSGEFFARLKRAALETEEKFVFVFNHLLFPLPPPAVPLLHVVPDRHGAFRFLPKLDQFALSVPSIPFAVYPEQIVLVAIVSNSNVIGEGNGTRGGSICAVTAATTNRRSR